MVSGSSEDLTDPRGFGLVAMLRSRRAARRIRGRWRSPPMPPAIPILGHVALLLLAASILSLGMFISCLSESTIFAAILTFALVLFLGSMDALATWLSNLNWPVLSQLGEAVGYLSVQKHFATLIKGVWDTSSVMMLVTYIILGVFLTAQYIEALRFGRS